MKIRQTFIAVFVTFLVLALSICCWDLYRMVKRPMVSHGQAPVIIVLGKSATATQFTNLLKQNNLISSKTLFLWIIRFQGASNQLKAGTYQTKEDESALHFLKRVITGDVMVFTLPIIAGTTQQKISQILQNTKHLEYNERDWDAIKGTYPNAEGLLLADTYQYLGGSNSQSLLLQAHNNLEAALKQIWESRELGLPYKNSYELLTAASIIEKETAVASERKLISGVIVNRLKKFMPLQMDPTVIYGLGDLYKGKLSHKDMDFDSPYNSYRYRGLPPTPICMVGQDAIDAAAHPQMSNYLYFVAKGDGTHEFSETYEQQKKAIKRYQ